MEKSNKNINNKYTYIHIYIPNLNIYVHYIFHTFICDWFIFFYYFFFFSQTVFSSHYELLDAQMKLQQLAATLEQTLKNSSTTN
jgi:hypothetical protein